MIPALVFLTGWTFSAWQAKSADCDFHKHMPKCPKVYIENMSMVMDAENKRWQCSMYYRCEINK